MATTAYLKSPRMRASLRRHPWVYGDSLERVEGEYQNGDLVVVRGPDGRFLAHAFINDKSRMVLRLLSFEKKTEPDDAFLQQRVRDAVALRHDLLGLKERANAYRLIHSEGDGLPGLIVDRYNDVLVISCTSLGTYQRLDTICDTLEELFSPRAILERGVSEGLRAKEGLPSGRGVIRGSLEDELIGVEIDGLKLRFAVAEGQKTGLFLDQRENVRRVAQFAAGRRVLDACCYVGSFGLACAKAGAASTHLFDSSERAIELAKGNAELNGLDGDGLTFRKGKLFSELHRLADEKQVFDLVIMDPPKYTGNAQNRKRARKGYFDTNLLALKLLAPGGLMLTCSCSHHVDADSFEQVVSEAATRAGAHLRVLERLGAGADHPVDVHCPQGRYLKALLLQRRS